MIELVGPVACLHHNCCKYVSRDTTAKAKNVAARWAPLTPTPLNATAVMQTYATLGTNNYNQATSPVQISGGRSWSVVVTGYYHTVC